MPILNDKVFQRLYAFTALTSLYGGILFTTKVFSIYWIIATVVEFMFFLWLFNYIKMEIYMAKTEEEI